MLVDAEIRPPKRPWALCTLPPVPAVALRVTEMLSHEETDVNQLVEMVQMDPAFAAELLRVANSPLYGFTSEIRSVKHATTALGLEFVKHLALTVALRAYVKSALRVPVLRRCWSHSVACAFLSQELATACSVPLDATYSAGLLHDIGRMGLLASYPTEYANLLSITQENPFDLLESESALFDINHCEAGAWLAKEWRLPQELTEVAEHHHDSPRRDTRLLTLVSLACRLADALEFAVLPTQTLLPVEEILAHLPRAAQDRVPPGFSLKAQVADRIDMLTNVI